jgi:bacterial leucyl aminopeptidase
MPDKISVVFFDLGDTLGTAVLSAPPVHLTGFQVFSFVPDLLQGLRDRGLRLGIVSNTGADGHQTVNAVLLEAGLLGFFEPGLCIYSKDVGYTKKQVEIFLIAMDRAGMSQQPGGCLFVGEDNDERLVASNAGMAVLDNPKLTSGFLNQP